VITEPLVRLGVVSRHAHVERRARKQDSHFGRFGGRLAVVGILLDEIARRNRAAPAFLVEAAVENDTLVGLEPDRAHRAPVGIVNGLRCTLRC
jgi:hypothetical protein